MTEISTLTKRRLQAQVIKPIYEEMEQVLGAEAEITRTLEKMVDSPGMSIFG